MLCGIRCNLFARSNKHEDRPLDKPAFFSTVLVRSFGKTSIREDQPRFSLAVGPAVPSTRPWSSYFYKVDDLFREEGRRVGDC